MRNIGYQPLCRGMDWDFAQATEAFMVYIQYILVNIEVVLSQSH